MFGRKYLRTFGNRYRWVYVLLALSLREAKKHCCANIISLRLCFHTGNMRCGETLHDKHVFTTKFSSFPGAYSRFQVTFRCKIPNFVGKFGNSLRSSKVHFRIRKPVCKLSIWLVSLSSWANHSLLYYDGVSHFSNCVIQEMIVFYLTRIGCCIFFINDIKCSILALTRRYTTCATIQNFSFCI